MPNHDIKRYCFDTSAWTDAYNRVYPARVFGIVWQRVEEALETGLIITPPQVITELRRQEDELAQWITKWPTIVLKPDFDAAAFMSQIARDFPAWTTTESSDNMADPWVVSIAQSFGLTAVSAELRGSDKNPKIPYVCRKYDIPHITFLQMMISEGWIFPASKQGRISD